MSKKHKKVTILDHLIPLNITYLNKVLDLKRIGKRSKEIKLYAINPVTGKNEIMALISITINIDFGNGDDYADVFYSVNGKQEIQRIELIAKKAPLKRGYVFYLKCPITGNQKRKLFLYNGRFVSKQVIENPHYLTQIQSRKQRNITKDVKKVVKYNNVVKNEGKKYFKKFYAGFPTKRYLKVLNAAKVLNTSW